MSSIILKEAHAALRIEQPTLTNPIIQKVGVLNKRQIVAISLLGAAAVIASVAAIACIIFNFYIPAIACAAASLVFMISAIAFSQIRNSEATLNLVKELSAKVRSTYAEVLKLKKELQTERHSLPSPASPQTNCIESGILNQTTKIEESSLINDEKEEEKTSSEMEKTHPELDPLKEKNEDPLATLKNENEAQDLLNRNHQIESLKKELEEKLQETVSLEAHVEQSVVNAKTFQQLMDETVSFLETVKMKMNESHLKKPKKSGISEDFFKALNPIDHHILQLKKSTPLLLQLECQPLVNFKEVLLDLQNEKKLTQILNEFYETEKSFYLKIIEIKLHFDTLKEKNLIKEDDCRETIQGWEIHIQECNALLEKLKSLADESAPLEDRLKALQIAFTPKNIKKYLEAYTLSTPHYRSVHQKIFEIKKSPAVVDLNSKFSGRNDLKLPEDYLIMPIQRLPRILLFMQNLSHAANWTPEFKKAFNHNLSYIEAYSKLINSLTSK